MLKLFAGMSTFVAALLEILIIRNYFDPSKLFLSLYLIKFSDISAKSFFHADIKSNKNFELYCLNLVE